MNYADCKQIDGTVFEALVRNGAGNLQRNIREINDLNVFPIPDGDTGDNMYRTIAGGLREMEKEPDAAIDKKAKALSAGMLLSARGNSGVILSQMFSGMSNGLEGLKSASVGEIARAFSEGVRRAYETVVTPVEGTILTVAREAADGVAPLYDATLGEFSARYLDRMKESLANTPELLDVLKEAGVVDSGGAGLYRIAQGAFDAIRGEAIETVEPHAPAQDKGPDLSLFTEDSVLEFGYCTEFLLRLTRSKTDLDAFDIQTVIDYLETIGDSIVALRSGSIVKVHVHTKTPSKAMEFCQQFGEFLTVKIENMTLQHTEHEKTRIDALPTVKRARTRYASCVVASGRGVMDVFTEMGVDRIIEGGQGHNPAINDFIEAFDALNADHIFVFPNNSNILMAAEQAAKLYKASEIHVVPSKNLGQAYAALAMLDYSFDTADEVLRNFVENMEYVETGLVTRAIRDVDYKDLFVKNNDYIGFTNKKVLSASANKTDALLMLCEKLGVGEKSIATVIFGENASDGDREAVRKAFSDRYPDKEYYEIEGEQEVYDFIIILE